LRKLSGQEPKISSLLKTLWSPVLVSALLLKAFISIRPVEIPLPTTAFDSGEPTDELVIFLPGIGDDMAAFERAGFIELLQESNPSVDSVVVDTHIGYYFNSSLPDRVYQDVILPYKKRGYKKFILVGISLGGYGALWINNKYGNSISGTVLLAPLLGRKSLIREIAASEDVRSWRSQLKHKPGPDERAWLWIDELIEPDSGRIPELILAFGREDKYQEAGNLLAESIPESHIFKNGGSHEWQTWHSLWSDITHDQAWTNLGESNQ
jgi:pimeloyl-ACP methyl ester carboxylesterase